MKQENQCCKEQRIELWKSVTEYLEAIKIKIPFGMLVGHGYNINDAKEFKKLKSKFIKNGRRKTVGNNNCKLS